MPRSSGTYTLPANSHAVSGNTISSTYFNGMIDDLATEMTNSLPRDGQAAMTGVLKGTDGTVANPSYTFGSDPDTGFYSYAANTIGVTVNGAALGRFDSTGWIGNVTGNISGGVVSYKDYATVASATTTDIGAATSNLVSITGTTTITGLGTVAAGTFREVVFSGALLLTYNATSLILPTAANITTVAGDTMEAVSLGSGNWRVLRYQRNDGTALSAYTLPTQTGNSGKALVTDGSAATWGSTLVASTATATTSGTSVDLSTAVPSWVKRITVNLNGVSTSGTSNIVVQIGSTTYTTSGYVSFGGIAGSASAATSLTAGFAADGGTGNATYKRYGTMTLTHLGSNLWVASFHGGLDAGGGGGFSIASGGSITLGGVLDRVRIGTVGGTDTFDLGSANITWE